MQRKSSCPTSRKGIFVEDTTWHTLKIHCTKQKINLVYKAGEIIKEWVDEHCAAE